MTKKVVALGMRRDVTWKGVLKHRGLLAALILFSWSYRLCNMHLERLLSLFRKSSPVKPYVERLLHSGFLSQVMQRHLQAGGEDFRKITRRGLIQEDAPVRARVRKKKQKKRAGEFQMSFQQWANAILKNERQTAGKSRTRAEYKGRMDELKAQYAQGGVVSQPMAHKDDDGVATGQTYKDRIQTSLSCCSSVDKPLVTEILQEEVDEVAPQRPNVRGGGLTDRLAPARAEYLKTLYSKDRGALPRSETYDIPLSCNRCHPDACSKKLSGDSKLAFEKALGIFKGIPRLSFISIQVSPEAGGTPKDYYKCVAYQDPMMFVRCFVEESGRPVFSKTADGDLSFETGQAAFARIDEPFASVDK